jgi:hypothetical protein
LVFRLFRFNRNIETLCFCIERNNRNKHFVSESAETSFSSSFGCFELKLVSRDTLLIYTQKRELESPPQVGSYPLSPLFCTQSKYFTRYETGLVCLPTQLERTLQLYW